MLAGFGLIVVFIVPFELFPSTIMISRYFGAGVKALLGLILSLVWLFIWDRQVRWFFFRKRQGINSIR